MDIDYIAQSGLSVAAKTFLTKLLLSQIEVEIYDSFSELIFSKGFRWIRECDDTHYYEEIAASVTLGTKVALVRKDLIRDLDFADKEDQAQIREMRYEEEQMEDQDETR